VVVLDEERAKTNITQHNMSILHLFGLALLAYFLILSVLASAVAVWQEAKIWKPRSIPSLSIVGSTKVFWFNFFWMFFCLLGSILVLLKWIFTLGKSDIAKETNRCVENGTAKIVMKCFIGNVQVKGIENLPMENIIPAPVYICNHASQLDVGAVYYLNRRFKWVAKKSVLYLPGVGQTMFLGQHVLIDRRKGKNEKSVNTLFQKCTTAVQAGLPVFFFPQGTRRIAERLPAKDGAFIIAETARSTLIPISIEIPMDAWNSWYPLNLLWGGSRPTIKLFVHKGIPVAEKETREDLKKRCMDQIYSVLPDPDVIASKVD
jgi:1-acyl-sn-glycerol-3-phosphate acyltransferase